MNKDLQDIIAAMQAYCELGLHSAALSPIDFYDRVVKPLEDHTEYMPAYDMGASKGVLIFEKQGIVLKIPFMANEYDEGQYECDLGAWDAGEIDEEPHIEDYVQPLCKAVNFFIETSRNWDYCELECGIYQEAEIVGLEAYFAKEEWVADIDGYPIYQQVLVSPFNSDYSSHTRTEEDRSRAQDSCTRIGVRCFNPSWIADFLDAYGEEELKKLDDFLKKLSIGDLHDGNVGYVGKYPVLLDYSNYND